MFFFKRKRDFADSSSIPENEKHFYSHDTYYNYSFGAVDYEDQIKTGKILPCGLYAPEVVAIFFCKNHPGKQEHYPAWYWRRYGIRDVGALQRSLEERGYIRRASVDEAGAVLVWAPTQEGQQVIDEYEYIIWAHRNPYHIYGINAWNIHGIVEKYKTQKGFTWKDAVWGYLNGLLLRPDKESPRNIRWMMAQFLYGEENYAQALTVVEEVIRLDRASGDFNGYKDGAPPGIINFKNKCIAKIQRIKE